MRVEIRAIEHTYYIASDGREFSNEKACKDYEELLQLIAEKRAIYVVTKEQLSPYPAQKQIVKLFYTESQAKAYIYEHDSGSYQYSYAQHVIEKEEV